MCQKKTKLMTARQCKLCNNEYHLLYFRFVERGLVYYFAKCTSCNYSYRCNATFNEWKARQKESAEIGNVSRHHRKPRSMGGTDDPSNIAMVTQRKHELWHAMWGNRSPVSIVAELNSIWLPPEITLIITKTSKS